MGVVFPLVRNRGGCCLEDNPRGPFLPLVMVKGVYLSLLASMEKTQQIESEIYKGFQQNQQLFA